MVSQIRKWVISERTYNNQLILHCIYMKPIIDRMYQEMSYQRVTVRNLPTNNKGTTGLKREGFDNYGLRNIELFPIFKPRMELKRSFFQL
jgi:hypothetical protein